MSGITPPSAELANADQSPWLMVPSSSLFDFYQLSDDLPRLTPNSELGRLTIEVSTKLEFYVRDEELLAARGQEERIDPDEREALERASLPTRAKIRVLYGFYNDLAEDIELMEDMDETAVLYSDLIADARREQLRRLEESEEEELAAIRPELQAFINEVALLYWVEADKHFQSEPVEQA